MRTYELNRSFAHYGPLSGAGGIASVVRSIQQIDNRRAHGAVVTATGRHWKDAFEFFKVPCGWLRSRKKTVSQVHVFHLSQGGSFLREGLLLFLGRLLGLHVVCFIHGSSYPKFAAQHSLTVSTCLRMARTVWVLTDEAYVCTRDLGIPASRIAKAVNVVHPPKHVRPVAERKEVVVFAGEVSQRKGVDLLIAAWPLVHRPDAELIIYGPPTQESPVVLPSRCTYGGAVPTARVVEALSTARVAVLPSRAEAQPMFILEAMAAGCPVIGTAVGGVPDLLKHGRGRITSLNPSDIANAITELLADAVQAQAYADAARLFVEKNHSASALRRMLAEMEAVGLP